MGEEKVVGAEGFEPPALCSQSRCATRLRYAPSHWNNLFNIVAQSIQAEYNDLSSTGEICCKIPILSKSYLKTISHMCYYFLIRESCCFESFCTKMDIRLKDHRPFFRDTYIKTCVVYP